MRRLCLAALSVLLLTTSCAGEDAGLDESAAREVEPLDDANLPISDDAADEPIVLGLAVPEGWSLDPADAGPASLTNRVIAGLLYEGLTSLDSERVPEPALADRWFVDEDRVTWTFVLPETLTDGAGEPLTARDVKLSLERVAARGGADQAATSLTAITGWSDRMNGDTGGVAGISAPDDTTLVIRLDTPYELLLEVLASPALGITGEAVDGSLRTTGAFHGTDDSLRFESNDATSSVAAVQLVESDDGPSAALSAGDADWAVLATGEGAGGLDADIIRQPLELEVAIVARNPVEGERLGLLSALEPLTLAPTVDGLTARSTARPADSGSLPAAAIVDLPEGQLEGLGDAVVAQLEAAGVAALAVTSESDEFAARVASGEALLFPIVIAGGTGPASAALRLSVPGASDDVFGPESESRAELAAAVITELDVEQRGLFIDALERSLINDGLLLPIGQFEVRIAISTRLDGLRHRSDGTLDLSAAKLADTES